MSISYTEVQKAVIKSPTRGTLFLEGPAGSGKTTAAVARMLHLLDRGFPASSILVLVPQRTLAAPYYRALRSPDVPPGGQVTVATVGGLAQRMADLFWPLVAGPAGFAHPDQPPVFLTLETAQVHMARLVRPLLDQGYFESVTIDRNRLYSQILDNLNKAAVVGFPHTEIGERLKSAWGGQQSQLRIYDEAQECANRFRAYCLAHNLLDFSLQIELFTRHLWPHPLCRAYLTTSYLHLIADNIEEDTPVAHDLLRDWLSECQSALLVCDHDGGYRRFLGADPEGAEGLRAVCDGWITTNLPFVASPDLRVLGARLVRSLNRPTGVETGNARAALAYIAHRYHPQMLDGVAAEIARLVRDEGVPPGQIAVLAPFLSDALRFALTHRLAQWDIPARSHRPSRALRDEPAARCLLTLATLAHPQWGFHPPMPEVVTALMQAIDGLDLVRAYLLTRIVYQERDRTLTTFEQIRPETQERLTFVLGERYDRLRGWLMAAQEDHPPDEPLDHFLSRLFGELLSQPGYGFHRHYDAARVAATLIESVRKFRQVMEGADVDPSLLGREYVQSVRDGIIAAQYLPAWQLQPDEAVLLAPATTFLMSNRAVEVQFWLEVGSGGWWERLNQPLTHPYVLSRHWPRGRVWSDADEFNARQETLARLVLGLVRRCRRRVYLGISELGEEGYEQRGPLLQAFQRMLREEGGSG